MPHSVLRLVKTALDERAPAPGGLRVVEAKGTPPPDLAAPLGAALVNTGAVTQASLDRALRLQKHSSLRLGDILMSNGWVSEAGLARGLAAQAGTELADLRTSAPDVRLIDALGPERCLRLEVLPWKRAGAVTLVATSRPEAFARLRPELEAALGRVRMVVTSRTAIRTAVLQVRKRTLARRAEHRTAPAESCRNWADGPLARRIALAGGILAGFSIAAPSATFLLLVLWATFALSLMAGLRVAALTSQILHMRRAARTFVSERTAPAIAHLPTVSLLVPLYREKDIATHLVRRLQKIDYPPDRLDICLILEEDDMVTHATLAAADLPAHMTQIVVPRGAVQTKPRALNFALDFARGSIIGIYDAEDAPAPDQLRKVVTRFHERGAEVACLQGRLDFYNPRQSWLARCFALDYATWFRIILPGLARLGFAIPLGGTTLFFRRNALEELGRWDAHNVTEDADLGIRLARRGYRTELIDTTTDEEACCRLVPWIRQRSRWLKGYALTYAVHMRRPLLLWRELGPRKFFGFQVLFLGTVSLFLLAPLLWSFWAIPLGLGHPLQGVIPAWALWSLVTVFITSELISMAATAVAVMPPGKRWLIPWIATLQAYYALGAIAALKALIELLASPFYWDKTAHGIPTRAARHRQRRPAAS